MPWSSASATNWAGSRAYKPGLMRPWLTTSGPSNARPATPPCWPTPITALLSWPMPSTTKPCSAGPKPTPSMPTYWPASPMTWKSCAAHCGNALMAQLPHAAAQRIVDAGLNHTFLTAEHALPGPGRGQAEVGHAARHYEGVGQAGFAGGGAGQLGPGAAVLAGQVPDALGLVE